MNLTPTYRLTKGTKGPNIRGICGIRVGLNALYIRGDCRIRVGLNSLEGVGKFTLFVGAHGCWRF